MARNRELREVLIVDWRVIIGKIEPKDIGIEKRVNGLRQVNPSQKILP